MGKTAAQPLRILGLDLAGAKNSKTTLLAVEHYPHGQKSFVTEVRSGIGNDPDLLEAVSALSRENCILAINAPTTLPPCTRCRLKCPGFEKCKVSEVRWMRSFLEKKPSIKTSPTQAKAATPYTQRPIELVLRHSLIPEFPNWLQFDVDETLGGNKAPLTARVIYLQPHLLSTGVRKIIEVSPKLTLASIGRGLKIEKRYLESYRKLDEGAFSRTKILEALTVRYGIFIYEHDWDFIASSLSGLDSLLCALTAVLSVDGKCAKRIKGFPPKATWLEYPTPAT